MSTRRALSRQGVVGHQRQPDLHGLAVAPLLREPLAEALERVQAKLADPLTLRRQPVLVPLGQQLARARQLHEPLFVGLARCLEEVVGEDGQLVDIVAHAAAETDQVAEALGEVGVDLAQAPERRPQTTRGVRLGGLGPEQAGDRGARPRSVGKGEACQQALFSPRQRHRFATDGEMESAKQLDRGVAHPSGPAQQPSAGCTSRVALQRHPPACAGRA